MALFKKLSSAIEVENIKDLGVSKLNEKIQNDIIFGSSLTEDLDSLEYILSEAGDGLPEGGTPDANTDISPVVQQELQIKQQEAETKAKNAESFSGNVSVGQGKNKNKAEEIRLKKLDNARKASQAKI